MTNGGAEENRVVEHGKGGEGVGELDVARALDSFLPKFLLQHYDIAVTHLYEERIPLSAYILCALQWHIV